MTEEEYISICVELCQGNPGALKVLTELSLTVFPPLFLAITIKLRKTESKAPCLWLVYKDECKMDLKKTKEMLMNWVLSHETDESLGTWLSKQNLKCSPEAAYYA